MDSKPTQKAEAKPANPQPIIEPKKEVKFSFAKSEKPQNPEPAPQSETPAPMTVAPSLQSPTSTVTDLAQNKDAEQSGLKPQSNQVTTTQSAENEKTEDFSLEKVEQTKRDWKETPNERKTYIKESSDYYKKILDLVKKASKITSESEKASQELNTQLNDTYSNASSTMGDFVEIGRKIENYVHEQIGKYTQKEKIE